MRLIHAFVAVSMSLTLMACSALPQSVRSQIDLNRIINGEPTAAPIRNIVAPTAAPAAVSTAALVRQRGIVRVGVRFDAPPLASVNAKGDLEGMDIELAREFAKRWLGDANKVEFVQVTSASAPQRIANREVDLAMGGLTHNRNAELVADFSITYLEDGEALLARAGTFSAFKDLARRPIAFVDSQTTFPLRDLQNSAGVTVTLQATTSYAQAMQLLSNGKVDAVAGNYRRLRVEASKNPQYAVFSVIKREPVAIMLPQDDSAWANLINLTLSAIMQDNVFANLHQKWFGVPPDAAGSKPLAQPAAQLTLTALPSEIKTNDTLARVRAAQKVQFGYRLGDDIFVRTDAKGALSGFEIDLAREMARRWLGAEGAAQFVNVADGNVTDAVQTGRLDIGIGAIAQTQANEAVIDLSVPIYQPTTNVTRTVNAATAVSMAVIESDSEWRDVVNLTLQDMMADGTYARLYRKAFAAAPPTLEVWLGDAATPSLIQTKK